MPYSNPVFDLTTKKIIRHIAPKTCLDIGAGAGKYGRFIRHLMPSAHSVGVEIEPDYILVYKLNEIYDEIRCIDAAKLIEDSIDEQYDLAILGDSLEHFRKSEGIDLLHFLVYRTRYILIIYPERYVQNSVIGYRSEAHLSAWGKHDFVSFKHSPILEADNQRLVLIEGYLSPENSLKEMASVIENSGFSIAK
ncbi:MAG: class I SAM-dependent methyltransferase [Anaerolineae bacterium]|nr:class I SAM-dependent methyltransferase [Anaerolineae bacterium]